MARETHERTFIVKALLPTVLGDLETHELRPNDLFIPITVDTAHVVPGPIDIDQFARALAQTLSAFPLYTGKVRRPGAAGEPWTIRLTNEGVSVTVVDNADAVAAAVPVDTIIQSPFALARPVDVSTLHLGTSEAPLLRVTITRFINDGATAVGLSYSHVAGDGWVVYSFLRFLSQAYLGLPPTNTISYEAVPYPPCPQTIEGVGVGSTPFLLNRTFPISALPAHLDRTRAPPSVRVAVRFTLQQLEAIRRGLLAKDAKDGPEPRVSLQDCLVALLAASTTRAEHASLPIRYVANLINHRGTRPMPSNAAGNALMQVVTEPVDTVNGSMLDVAKAIRASIVRARDPDFTSATVAVNGRKWLDAAESHESLDLLTPDPGYILVNSTRPFDWTSAHFGYPGRTRFFHTMSIPPRFMKIFTPNPILLDDGTWKEYKGGAEVVFYVHKDIEGPFHQIILEEAGALGVPGDIEYITVA